MTGKEFADRLNAVCDSAELAKDARRGIDLLVSALLTQQAEAKRAAFEKSRRAEVDAAAKLLKELKAAGLTIGEDGTLVAVHKRARRSGAGRAVTYVVNGKTYTTVKEAAKAAGTTSDEIVAWATKPENCPGGKAAKYNSSAYTALRNRYVQKHFGIERVVA